MFNIAKLVLYGTLEGGWVILNAQVLCSWFWFSAHPTQSLVAQGGTQGFGVGKDGVLPVTGESRGCRDCSAPTSVTPKEGILHVRSVGTGIASQITLIGVRIIMV